MISVNSPVLLGLNQSHQILLDRPENSSVDFTVHPQWNHQTGWKNTLNNLRLIAQPLLLLWLISPWLDVFPNSYLLLGFNQLISAMNGFKPFYSSA
jgi:hypothetical protein